MQQGDEVIRLRKPRAKDMTDDDRLSQIQTQWSVVLRAHADNSAAVKTAQQEMIDRYGKAIRRYLLGALRDETAADEMFQEFAVRFVKGDYSSADPSRGRFRNFLRTILVRLVVEHHRRRKRNKSVQADVDFAEPAIVDPPNEEDDFTDVWRNGLLKRTWDALEALEQRKGKPMFTVMHARVENPGMNSSQLANRVSTQLGKNITTSNLRVMLHRARDEFAKLLLDEVAQTVDQPSRTVVEEELIELGLLEYCRPALDRL